MRDNSLNVQVSQERSKDTNQDPDIIDYTIKVGNFCPLIWDEELKAFRFFLVLNKGSTIPGAEKEGIKYGLRGGTAEFEDELISGISGVTLGKDPKSGELQDLELITKSSSSKFKLLSRIIRCYIYDTFTIEKDPRREFLEELGEIIDGYQKSTLYSESEITQLERRFNSIHIDTISYSSDSGKKRSFRGLFAISQTSGISVQDIKNRSKKVSTNSSIPIVYFPTLEEIKSGKTLNGIKLSKTAKEGLNHILNSLEDLKHKNIPIHI